MTVTTEPPGGRRYRPSSTTLRRVLLQAVVVAVILAAGYALVDNARHNLAERGIATGFGFIVNTAGFDVSQTLIDYDRSHSYGRVFVVGLLNTLLVAGLGIVLATIIGFAVGIARLSSNWVLARLAGAYVEITRNLPLLFQILFWYLAVLGTLPSPRQSVTVGLAPLLDWGAATLAAWNLTGPAAALAAAAHDLGPPGIFLNNRGIVVPRPVFGEGFELVGVALLAGLAAAAIVGWIARAQHASTGRSLPTGWIGLMLVVGAPFGAFVVLGGPLDFEQAELRGFNFVGGLRVVPEFAALLIALSTYTAGFIAEIVRAGIQAVHRGQTEAAYSLGLRPGPTLRLVVIPQALRVIVPPLTSQYLNLTKNSSLAVAIGYPDLVAVFAGTTLNQTGQAIEIIAITMAVYLALSLATSLAMNLYNRRLAAAQR